MSRGEGDVCFDDVAISLALSLGASMRDRSKIVQGANT